MCFKEVTGSWARVEAITGHVQECTQRLPGKSSGIQAQPIPHGHITAICRP